MDESRTGNSLPLVLASASPRRSELLRLGGFDFEQRPAHIDESTRPGEPAEDYVLRLAEEKARAAWRRGTRTLGADTVVVLGDEVLCKPIDEDDAKRMLGSLSGRTHRVLTGVAVFDGTSCRVLYAETRVTFRVLEGDEIGKYVATGEAYDKAGSYGIQGWASKFVESVEGSYTNVVGLPLELVSGMLR